MKRPIVITNVVNLSGSKIHHQLKSIFEGQNPSGMCSYSRPLCRMEWRHTPFWVNWSNAGSLQSDLHILYMLYLKMRREFIWDEYYNAFLFFFFFFLFSVRFSFTFLFLLSPPSGCGRGREREREKKVNSLENFLACSKLNYGHTQRNFLLSPSYPKTFSLYSFSLSLDRLQTTIHVVIFIFTHLKYYLVVSHLTSTSLLMNFHVIYNVILCISFSLLLFPYPSLSKAPHLTLSLPFIIISSSAPSLFGEATGRGGSVNGVVWECLRTFQSQHQILISSFINNDMYMLNVHVKCN